MDEYGSLRHTKRECKYHVVFIPNCHRKVLYEQLRRDLGKVFRQLAQQKESRFEEGRLKLRTDTGNPQFCPAENNELHSPLPLSTPRRIGHLGGSV